MASKFDEPVLGDPQDICKDAGLIVEKSESYLLLYILKEAGYARLLSENTTSYHITPKGVFFIEGKSGGFINEFKTKAWIEFPKKHWYLISIGSFIVGLIAPIIQTSISQRISQSKPKSKLTIQVSFGKPLDSLREVHINPKTSHK